MGSMVAPRAGAWIETQAATPGRYKHLWSHPVRVRGLKQRSFVYTAKDQKVAPRAGAWIETGEYWN